MKIVCTEDQKPLIVEALASSYHCFLPRGKVRCQYVDSCSECLEKNIEWQIEDGDGEQKDIETFLRQREPYMFEWGNNTCK